MLSRDEKKALSSIAEHHLMTRQDFRIAYTTLIPRGYVDASGTWKLTPKGHAALRGYDLSARDVRSRARAHGAALDRLTGRRDKSHTRGGFRRHQYRVGDVIETPSHHPARITALAWGDSAPGYRVESGRGVRHLWNEDMNLRLVKRRGKRYARDHTAHHHRNPSAPSFRKQKRISEKIRILREEGYPPKQAEAIAYRMAGVPKRPAKRRSRA